MELDQVGAALSVGLMWLLYLTGLYHESLEHPLLHDLIHAHVLFSGSSGRIHDYRPGRTVSSATEQPASASFTVVGQALVPSPSPSRP